MLKLPKSLQSHPKSPALLNTLLELSRPLFENSATEAPFLDLSAAHVHVLRGARRAGLLIGGMEKIEKTLDQQSQGFRSLARRGTPSTPTETVRLILLSNDGSQRFYRSAERLARRHEPWVGVAVLNASSADLGPQFFGPNTAVKALLIDHKDWVCRFLESWLEESRTNR